jgi:hypothetical protein
MQLTNGSSLIGDVGVQYRNNHLGAASVHHIVAAATANPSNVKNSAGRLVGYDLSNITAAWRYVKLHNTTSAPTPGVGVVMTIGIPPNGKAVGNLDGGIGFSTGIGRTVVTGAADADATATAVNDVVGDLFFA